MKNDRVKNETILVLIIILFASSPLALAQQEETKERVITIEASRFSYKPEIIEVNEGDKVTIRFISTDVHHGLFIDGYELSTDTKPGEEGNITFVADRTGKFAMRCSVTCGPFHPYMISYLKVKPDYRLFTSIYLALIVFIVSILFVSRRQKP